MAIRNNKGFNAKQSKRVARQMQDSYIGTHNVRRPAARGDAFGGNANRGSVYGVRQQDERGVRYKGNRIQRQQRSKSVLLFIISLVVIIVVGVLVGRWAFFKSLESKIALHDSSVAAALSNPTEGKPCYALFVADLTSSGDQNGIDAILIARIDEQGKTASLLSIPYNFQACFSDGQYRGLNEANANGGDAELIRAVKTATGLPISHIMRTDASGMQTLTGALGGVSVTLEEPLDDPRAGDVYLGIGAHTITGKEACTYLKASNFTDGTDERGRNQCAFAAALAEAVEARSGLDFLFAFDKNASCIQTDWTPAELIALHDQMAGLTADSVLQGIATGYETAHGTKVFVPYSNDFAKIIELFKNGERPVLAEGDQTLSIDPADVSVIVKNGSGVTGEAAIVAETLKEKGFNVTETANADSYVYEETLVIYKLDEMEDAATAVQRALGYGRVIPSAGFYDFDSDVLVMYGGDRKIVSS